MFDRIHQGQIIHRLPQKIDRSRAQRLHLLIQIRTAGDKHNRESEAGFVHAALEFKSTHGGQEAIKNKALARLDPAEAEKVRSRCKHFRIIPKGAKQSLCRTSERHVVIND